MNYAQISSNMTHTRIPLCFHSTIISYFKVELVFVESDLRSKSGINVLKIVELLTKVVVSALYLVRFAVEIFHRKDANDLTFSSKKYNLRSLLKAAF